MANVAALAASARRKLLSGDALTEVDAISKAIRGAGITYKPDHKRLMREVGRRFARDKADAARDARRGVA